MTEREDRVFKQLADLYVEHYGQDLLEQRRALEAQNIRYATPRADERARQLTGKRKRRARTPYFIAAAALLLVFISVPVILANQGVSIFDLLRPTPSDSSTQSSSADTTQDIRALTFDLPSQFTVASVEADQGETIYYLDNTHNDDVILSVREAEGQEAWSSDMDEIYINNSPVPAKIRDEFKLLAFENRGLRYTICCRDDLATLTSLYLSIVGAESGRDRQ